MVLHTVFVISHRISSVPNTVSMTCTVCFNVPHIAFSPKGTPLFANSVWFLQTATVLLHFNGLVVVMGTT
jgi:hypothetical protein